MINHHTPDNTPPNVSIRVNGKVRSGVRQAWTFGPFIVIEVYCFDEKTNRYVIQDGDILTYFRFGIGGIVPREVMA